MSKYLKRGYWFVCRQPCGGGYVVGWAHDIDRSDDPTHYPLISLGVMTYPSPHDVERRIAEIMSGKKATSRGKGPVGRPKPLAPARKSANAKKSPRKRAQ